MFIIPGSQCLLEYRKHGCQHQTVGLVGSILADDLGVVVASTLPQQCQHVYDQVSAGSHTIATGSHALLGQWHHLILHCQGWIHHQDALLQQWER